MALMMADSDMHPTGTPPSSTGSWEMPFWPMISTARLTGSSGVTESTGAVMTVAAVTVECSAACRTSTIFASVLTLGSTLPASIRATMDWLIPAIRATSACFKPIRSLFSRSSAGVGISILLL
ncbi:MAG: hypothetical protein BWX50_01456 [Euryarchaeota archaeon ADurb.Bin009]|nr:MAG: hypothetical protein BWX50_01456 [Euryarchaeota archaeon ADurb.Bin009]